MTLSVNNSYYNPQIGIYRTTPIKCFPFFKGNKSSHVIGDTFTTNAELAPFISETAVQNMINTNPNIGKILREHGINNVKINTKELNKLASGHLKATKNISAGIINNLPEELKTSINKQAVLQAAMFHDFGKVLVPEKILNKKCCLNAKEKAIMELHSELGYELLKTQNLPQKTLELVKYHHQTAENTGYPLNTDNFEYNLEAEILTLADKFSALTEQRCYKNGMTNAEALEIIKAEHKPSPALEALTKFVEA